MTITGVREFKTAPPDVGGSFAWITLYGEVRAK